MCLLSVLNSSLILSLRPYGKIVRNSCIQLSLSSLSNWFSCKIHSIPVCVSCPLKFFNNVESIQKVFAITFAKISIQNFTERIWCRVPETRIMSIESFIKILGCFSYILKFTFVASDKINHIGEVVVNIDCLNQQD